MGSIGGAGPSGGGTSAPYTDSTYYTGGTKSGIHIGGVSYTGLAPELGLTELMTWLTHQMSSADSEIRRDMDAIGTTHETVKALKELQVGISAMRSKLDDKKLVEVVEPWKTYADDPSVMRDQPWYKGLDDSGRKAVEDFLARTIDDGKGGKDYIVAECDLDALKTGLNDEISSINSSNEMAMIQLQSRIAARGQMIQLVSNMVNAMNETAKNCISKIG